MKSMLAALCFFILSSASTAFALTNYNQTDILTNINPLNTPHPSASFSFTGIDNSFSGSPTPTLAIQLENSNSLPFTASLYLGNTLLTTFSNDTNPTYSFDATSLTNLNSAIQAGTLTFRLDRNPGSTGTIKLSSATLNGTLAPEPVSMVLVGAGLVALPFARRIRKSISK